MYVQICIRDTGKGYTYRFLFILFPIACFTSVLVFYNQFLLCKKEVYLGL